MLKLQCKTFEVDKGAVMLNQKFNHLIPLYPSVLLEDWHVENVSGRQEGEKWETLWFQVITPTGMFRVKEFFLDIMEPTFAEVKEIFSSCKGIKNGMS